MILTHSYTLVSSRHHRGPKLPYDLLQKIETLSDLLLGPHRSESSRFSIPVRVGHRLEEWLMRYRDKAPYSYSSLDVDPDFYNIHPMVDQTDWQDPIRIIKVHMAQWERVFTETQALNDHPNRKEILALSREILTELNSRD